MKFLKNTLNKGYQRERLLSSKLYINERFIDYAIITLCILRDRPPTNTIYRVTPYTIEEIYTGSNLTFEVKVIT